MQIHVTVVTDMAEFQLHKAQVSILKSLRRSEMARYTTLRKPTDLNSDTFKFHLQKLAHLGYVQKLPVAGYKLTPKGKEYANNLDEQVRATQKQPKHSLIIVTTRVGPDGDKQYLFQQRHRQPYWGYWGLISGPVQWGVEPEETAALELTKQTGLTASFKVKAFYRQRDYNSKTQELLEDKLFHLIEAADPQGSLSDAWSGGTGTWMTLEELEAQPKYFAETRRSIELLDTGIPYASYKTLYDPAEY